MMRSSFVFWGFECTRNDLCGSRDVLFGFGIVSEFFTFDVRDEGKLAWRKKNICIRKIVQLFPFSSVSN